MKRWLPTIVFFAFVGFIIFLADEGFARGFFNAVQNSGGGDKAGHFVLMGGLAFCLNYSLRRREWHGFLIGTLIVLALCTAEEFSQLLSPYRHFDWGDLAADYAGIALASWLARKLVPGESERAKR